MPYKPDMTYCCACKKLREVNYRGAACDDIPTCAECDSDELDFEYTADDDASEDASRWKKQLLGEV